MRYLVGLDDTDSASGMCTTYLAYRIASDLRPKIRVLPFPRLVRLNPNIPFKTRGNAAVSLTVEADDGEEAFADLCEVVSRYSDVENGANTGLVFLDDSSLMPLARELYQRALKGVVNPKGLASALRGRNARVYTLGNGMGIVGAFASLGFDASFDHTFELIAYRRRGLWGTRRIVEPDSVRQMELATFPHTFNSYDHQKAKVLIAPHGPDPVLAGIRGDSPGILLRAFRMLRFGERPEGYMVYLTNQCTDAHLSYPLDDKVYSSGWFEGEVASSSVGEGGHVYITVRNGPSALRCAVYEPTGDLRRVARLLAAGDRVRVFGGIRRPSRSKGRTLNIEKIEVLSLAQVRTNPSCKNCGRRMKSEGQTKGFQCRSCGARAPPSAAVVLERALQPGVYLPSPRAHRHLTKPLIRYGAEKAGYEETGAVDWLAGPARPVRGHA
jgi:tRNA(Ile2)-agmatinylcytidine synthase